MKLHGVVAAGAAVGILILSGAAFADSPYAGFANGPSTDPNFFAIGVFYQNLQSSVINGYAAMHINVWDYPDSISSSQLTMLKNAGMSVVMPFDATEVNNKTVVGWFNPPDEPDNAQSNGRGGYGDPVQPSVMIAQYNAIKAQDSTRPVLLDLGQAVAWDGYYGRGSRSGKPGDYVYNGTYKWTDNKNYTGGYTAGSDIAAFDFYPVNSTDASVAGKINLVGYGVSRLLSWSPPGHPVWNYIETTNIDTTDASPGPTPAQVKAEVWLSLVHGSTGIMYFAHQNPGGAGGVTDELLLDPIMNPAVTAINAQVESLAPELNSATQLSGTITTGTASNVHLDFMTKFLGGNEYIFSVADQNSNGVARFYDPAMSGLDATVDVLGENRTLSLVGGSFTDSFANNGVHLYEIEGTTSFDPSLSAPTPVPEPASLGILSLGILGLMKRPRREKRR